jgi:hypothetical protein
MHLKNGKSSGNGAYMLKNTTLKVWWPVGSKLVIDGSTRPGNYGYYIIWINASSIKDTSHSFKEYKN